MRVALEGLIMQLTLVNVLLLYPDLSLVLRTSEAETEPSCGKHAELATLPPICQSGPIGPIGPIGKSNLPTQLARLAKVIWKQVCYL